MDRKKEKTEEWNDGMSGEKHDEVDGKNLSQGQKMNGWKKFLQINGRTHGRTDGRARK